jgi:hypothetical protein
LHFKIVKNIGGACSPTSSRNLSNAPESPQTVWSSSRDEIPKSSNTANIAGTLHGLVSKRDTVKTSSANTDAKKVAVNIWSPKPRPRPPHLPSIKTDPSGGMIFKTRHGVEAGVTSARPNKPGDAFWRVFGVFLRDCIILQWAYI